ncbi:hypothetical protein MBOL_29480 [Mycobacteroides abscessus subsp. bolletii BD]|nr:hypothetical protein MBOL_29480 [Mycobacteroides abscessus subsp. bolletii BD]
MGADCGCTPHQKIRRNPAPFPGSPSASRPRRRPHSSQFVPWRHDTLGLERVLVFWMFRKRRRGAPLDFGAPRPTRLR